MFQPKQLSMSRRRQTRLFAESRSKPFQCHPTTVRGHSSWGLWNPIRLEWYTCEILTKESNHNNLSGVILLKSHVISALTRKTYVLVTLLWQYEGDAGCNQDHGLWRVHMYGERRTDVSCLLDLVRMLTEVVLPHDEYMNTRKGFVSMDLAVA